MHEYLNVRWWTVDYSQQKMNCCRCNRSGHCKSSEEPILPLRLGNYTNLGRRPTVRSESLNVIHFESENGVSNRNLRSSPESSHSCVDRDSRSRETPDLPAFTPMAPSRFLWGDLDSETFILRLNSAYSTIVHWKRNIFAIPSGKVGTTFVNELSRLFRAYAVGSTLESVALKAALTMCPLLLQKPSRSSKSKDHIACLEELHHPAPTDLPKNKECNEDESVRRAFVKKMSTGNTRAALRKQKCHPSPV